MFFFTYDLKHIYLEVNNLLDSGLKKNLLKNSERYILDVI